MAPMGVRSSRVADTVQAPPHSPQVEASVVGQMLADARVVGEVIGTLLAPEHFYVPAFRAIYRTLVEAYYADEPMDALSVGHLCAKALARTWDCSEEQAVARVQQLAAGRGAARSEDAVAHARLVKRDADYRSLLDLAATIHRSVQAETEAPDAVAGLVAHTATQIATGTLASHQVLSYEQLGRNFVAHQRKVMAARAAGIELGAYFGLSFLDNWIRGLQPTELMFLAGDPGAGKSAVAWRAAQGFAERQIIKPPEERVGTLVLSLEMSEQLSSQRLAQNITGLDGSRLREGRTDEGDLARVIGEWRARKGIPLWFNFAKRLRAGQMRALIVEEVRRHNVGLVLIDHFRYFTLDGRFNSKIDEEEAKAEYLAQEIAGALDVAVICLAHTAKHIDTDDKRPNLTHLRGGQMIAAHADVVGFVFRPYKHARPKQIEDGEVKRTDAELIFAKNRQGLEGTSRFYFDPSTMDIH
jgi:replicative DNA helicase